MTPERWQRIEEVFGEASELPTGPRAEFLERACGEDRELRDEVASLLARSTGARESLRGAVASEIGRISDMVKPSHGRPTARAVSPRRARRRRRHGRGVPRRARRRRVRRNGRDQGAARLRQLGSRGAVSRRAAASSPRSTTRTSCGCSTAAATDDGCRSSSWSYIEGVPIDALRTRARAVGARARRDCSRRCAPRCSTRTRTSSSTAISSRATSWSRPMASRSLLDFGIAKLLDPVAGGSREARTRTGVRAVHARVREPRAGARRAGDRSRPTSTRSAACCTSC